MKIGQLMKDIMHASELRQIDLAEIFDCTQSTVSKLKRDMHIPSLLLAQKIVSLAKQYKLKVKLEDLILTD